jgi:hypothetical protein
VPDVLEYSWRYQLPAVVTLPPAGMLGFGAAAERSPGAPGIQDGARDRNVGYGVDPWVGFVTCRFIGIPEQF